MNYNIEDMQGKKRSVGAEAPSSRVFDVESNEHIIGMMAVNVQLLISTYDLNEPYSEFLKKLDVEYAEKKLNYFIITKSSVEDINSFLDATQLKCAIVVQDKNDDFGKRFGVQLDQEKFPQKIANFVTVIDKEGEMKYANYFSEPSNEFFKEITNITTDTINFKRKGHVHENWMGV